MECTAGVVRYPLSSTRLSVVAVIVVAALTSMGIRWKIDERLSSAYSNAMAFVEVLRTHKTRQNQRNDLHGTCRTPPRPPPPTNGK